MKGQRIGYIRVSAYDQNPERQLVWERNKVSYQVKKGSGLNL